MPDYRNHPCSSLRSRLSEPVVTFHADGREYRRLPSPEGNRVLLVETRSGQPLLDERGRNPRLPSRGFLDHLIRSNIVRVTYAGQAVESELAQNLPPRTPRREKAMRRHAEVHRRKRADARRALGHSRDAA